MIYKIQTITFPGAVQTGVASRSAVQPFGNLVAGDPVSFKDVTLGSIKIQDGNATYQRFQIGNHHGTHQTLIEQTTFGVGDNAQTLAEGVQLTNVSGTFVESVETGDRFFLTFPYEKLRLLKERAFLGKQTVLLVFPQPTENDDGSLNFPKFDRAAEFKIERFGANKLADEVHRYVDCFVEGTMIQTADGLRPVETLCTGDLIATRDHGLHPVRWIGGTTVTEHGLDLQPNLRPIEIKAGALGPNMPSQDLYVSPQHRILLRSTKAQRMFGLEEVLVAAKHLTELPGISAVLPKNGVTYWHFILDQHEIVMSNGAWTETLYTGPQALRNLSKGERREILTLFPELNDPEFRPLAARRLLNGKEGRKIARRQAKNASKPLYMD